MSKNCIVDDVLEDSIQHVINETDGEVIVIN
jgi:hypothetical protein